MSTPQTTPNTAAPAVPATAQVVRVLSRSPEVTCVAIRKQAVAVIDFYPNPTNPEK